MDKRSKSIFYCYLDLKGLKLEFMSVFMEKHQNIIVGIGKDLFYLG